MVKSIQDTKTPEEYYSQFANYSRPKYDIKRTLISLRKLVPRLKSLGIYVINTGWYGCWNSSDAHVYRVDDALASKKLNRETPTISYNSYRVYHAERDGKFYLNYDLIDRKTIKELFIKEFGTSFACGSKYLLIKLKKL